MSDSQTSTTDEQKFLDEVDHLESMWLIQADQQGFESRHLCATSVNVLLFVAEALMTHEGRKFMAENLRTAATLIEDMGSSTSAGLAPGATPLH